MVGLGTVFGAAMYHPDTGLQSAPYASGVPDTELLLMPGGLPVQRGALRTFFREGMLLKKRT